MLDKPNKSATNRVIRQLIKLLEQHAPECFNAYWIERHDRGLYTALWSLARSDGWEVLIAHLPSAWASRWTYELHTTGLSLEDEVKIVESVLARFDPPRITPYWLERHCGAQYWRLKRKLRTKKGRIDWPCFIERLQPNWKGRWLLQSKKEKKAYKKQGQPNQQRKIREPEPIEKTIQRLVTLLEQKQPKHFSRKWIRKQSQALYRKLRAYLAADSSRDWNNIILQLPDVWRSRWHIGRWQVKEWTPSIRYKDRAAVEEVLGAHKPYLYTFVTATTQKERSARNLISRQLVSLAQKGNISAEECLMELFIVLVEHWVTNDKRVRALEFDQDLVQHTLRRCIYLYRERASFVWYVYKSLAGAANSLKKLRKRRIAA